MTAPESALGPAGEAAASPPAEARTWFRGKLWFWLPWPVLAGLDLWTKALVFDFLREQAPTRPENRRSWLVFDGDLRLDLVSWGNTGTIWGMFADGTIVLMVLRCAAVIGLLVYIRMVSASARLLQFVLSLVLAGAIGNLYDNFTRADRSVRDFLRFRGTWPTEWEFPAFNLADSCITVGAIGLCILLLFDGHGTTAAKAGYPAAGPGGRARD